MELAIGQWTGGYGPEPLGEIAALWNRNAADRHGFFPWSGELLHQAFRACGMVDNSRLVEARVDGALVGFAHATWMREYGYPPGGSIEAVMVDRQWRKRGVGTALVDTALNLLDLAAPGLELVDALGAWPYGALYTCLADGSERSGVFSTQPDLYALFEKAGFKPARKSLVMRAEARAATRPMSLLMRVRTRQRTEDTWLDRAFRARELWDHNLIDWKGNLLSRAIYGFMPGESAQEGENIYSLFGVNTPEIFRGSGFAGLNIDHLLGHVASLGGDQVELHVYADNEPALALYRRAGFREVAETVMMLRV